MRVLPAAGEMLCAKGRFGFAAFDRNRVTKPLVRQSGQLVETSWQEAFKAVAGAVQRVKSQGGKSGFGVFVAPSATVEEAAAVSWFGRRALGAEAIHTFAADAAGGLPQVFGRELPYSGFDELVATDLILMIGSCNESRVAAFKVRRAVGRGARLVLWSPEPTLVDDLAETVIEAGNSTVFLKEVLAAVSQPGCQYSHRRALARFCPVAGKTGGSHGQWAGTKIGRPLPKGPQGDHLGGRLRGRS